MKKLKELELISYTVKRNSEKLNDTQIIGMKFNLFNKDTIPFDEVIEAPENDPNDMLDEYLDEF